MFECTTTLNIHPGRLAECILILRGTILPILRAQPGLLSLALIPQPHANQVSILSIWKSPAHARTVEYDPRYRLAVKLLDPLVKDKVEDNERRPMRPAMKTHIWSKN